MKNGVLPLELEVEKPVFRHGELGRNGGCHDQGTFGIGLSRMAAIAFALVAAAVDPAGAGTVSVATEEGNAASCTATANAGWEFVSWTVTWNTGISEEMTENPTYGLNIAEFSSVTAHFREQAPATTYKITATPKDRSYTFDGWNTAKDGSGTAYIIGLHHGAGERGEMDNRRPITC